MSLEAKFKFENIVVDLSKVSNPRLVKVLRARVHDGEKFLFWYSDHTDEPIHSEYSDYNDRYSDNHFDHKDHHNDYTTGWDRHIDEHTDKSK